MPHAGSPQVAAIPGQRHQNVHLLCIKRVTGERHVVFPAQQAAQAAELRGNHTQAACITRTPHHAFRIGGHQLAVRVQDCAVISDGHHRVEKR